MSKFKKLLRTSLVPVIAILLTLIFAAILLMILGKDPGSSLLGFLRGSGILPRERYAGGQSMWSDFCSFLSNLTPMIFASLGVTVGMRSGLFNIGIAGQMTLAAFVATITVGYSNLASHIAMPLVILIGIVTGALVGALVGALKHFFNVHEVVSTIMLNYIISYVTGFFINTYYVDLMTRNSKPIRQSAKLVFSGKIPSASGYSSYEFPLGLILALLLVFVVKFMFDKTTVGFKIKAVGSNKYCAAYAGINVGRNLILTMTISGALAGLAGVTYFLGFNNQMVPKQLVSLGYDSIAVSVLGNVTPIGTLLASILVTIFQKGSVYMSSVSEVPVEIASVITGILLMLASSNVFINEKLRALFVAATARKAAKK